MPKSYLYTILVLIITLVLAGGATYYIKNTSKNSINQNTKNIFVGNKNEIVTYTDINGNLLSLEDYLGNILVVNSWASWTPFSESELSILSTLADEYKSKDVVFLAVNRKETKERAQRYASTLDELNSLVIVLDPEDRFYSSIGGYAMPETVIYNKKGEVIEHIHGTISKEKVESILKNLISD